MIINILLNATKLISLSLLLFLASCGGGGGGDGGGSGSTSQTLYPSVTYPSANASLYTPSTVTPTITGMQGHTPICVLSWGALPQGMALNSNCNISGTPLETGTFNFQLTLTSPGVTGSYTTGSSIYVDGPVISYNASRNSSQPFYVGEVVNAPPSPQYGYWAPPSGLSITWLYQIISGSLPPGLTLGPTTGIISGAHTAAGSYSATVKVTVSSTYGTYSPQPGTYDANVYVDTFSYPMAGGNNIYVSQPFDAGLIGTVPGVYGNFTLTAGPLPPALTLDVSTGHISGTPDSLTMFNGYGDQLSATVTTPGGTFPTTGCFCNGVISPVSISYFTHPYVKTPIHAGAPVTVTPIITQVSPTPLTAATYSYAPNQSLGCMLPSGLTLNPATGVISGATTTIGDWDCFVDVTITNNSNGISWKVLQVMALGTIN